LSDYTANHLTSGKEADSAPLKREITEKVESWKLPLNQER
jgi:hypothetical protein